MDLLLTFCTLFTCWANPFLLKSRKISFILLQGKKWSKIPNRFLCVIILESHSLLSESTWVMGSWSSWGRTQPNSDRGQTRCDMRSSILDMSNPFILQRLYLWNMSTVCKSGQLLWASNECGFTAQSLELPWSPLPCSRQKYNLAHPMHTAPRRLGAKQIQYLGLK